LKSIAKQIAELALVEREDIPREFRTSEGLSSWISENKPLLEDALKSKGGILFRGFGLREAAEFQKVIGSFRSTSAPKMEYVGGTTPREKVTGEVYTSTNAPSFIRIPQHSEMSYLKEYPARILFFCKQPPRKGGETPLSDNRKILRDLPSAVRKKFEERGVLYVRNLVPETRMRKILAKKFPIVGLQTWQGVFKTSDKSRIEEICSGSFTAHQWDRHETLRVESLIPAVRQHPGTSESVWFNQAYFSQIHPRICGKWMTPVLKAYHWTTGKPFTNARFGDGSAITDGDLEAVMDSIEKNTFAVPWKQGDVLVLDNLLMSHGRNPYRGPRQILVGMIH
jgi:alpha-ketoglutarate-dependent taurine dioxygenase